MRPSIRVPSSSPATQVWISCSVKETVMKGSLTAEKTSRKRVAGNDSILDHGSSESIIKGYLLLVGNPRPLLARISRLFVITSPKCIMLRNCQ